MTHQERLRHYAQNFEIYGSDVGQWGSVVVLIERLLEIANYIEELENQVREKGESKENAG